MKRDPPPANDDQVGRSSPSTILVVGDGMVARALATALDRSGPTPLRWSRRSGGPIPSAQVVILAVKDAAISEVAEQVIGACGATTPILLHCAGALAAAEPFVALVRRPLGVGLLHPLRSLAGAPEDAEFRSVIFGVQGDERGRAAALELVGRLGGIPVLLEGDRLARYHAAAVLVANHSLGLVDAGRELLGSVGLDSQTATRALSALFSSTALNLERVGLPSALTGPIERGDVAVIVRHLDALKELPELDRLYRASARRVLRLAQEKGRAPDEALAQIERLFDRT